MPDRILAGVARRRYWGKHRFVPTTPPPPAPPIPTGRTQSNYTLAA